jgi:peptide/nickel transport system ATP-binding protein
LLEDIKARLGITMVFIAHDLAVVKHVSDRVAVMYLGKICELAPPDALYHHPAHPYTEALLASIPEPDPTRGAHTVPKRLSGDIPSPINPPSGCRFRTRCPYAQDRCAQEEPQVREVAPGQFVACHFPLISDTAFAQPVASAGAPQAS